MSDPDPFRRDATEAIGALTPLRTGPAGLPFTTRAAIEIPKPRDWQPFQRNCVLLFGEFLNDRHPQEYGRSGQDQRGIDILLRRNGASDDFVGVQCRLITKPDRAEKIEKDARAALKLKIRLRELIFATTAPDDTLAADTAHEVEQRLRAQGYDLRIVVYGWGQLQLLIAQYDKAYAAFNPAAFATHAPQSSAAEDLGKFADLVADRVLARQGGAVPLTPTDASGRDLSEDPPLHARIDVYRDFIRKEGEPRIAERGLLELLEQDLSGKPWAQYRLLTNLGVAALELGREEEGARRLEEAFAVRPDDPDAKANLALARTIQGRYAEAMRLAAEALAAEPPSVAAVSVRLQAAARSDWDGDPMDLVPERYAASRDAAIGLAEFYRRRARDGWQRAVLEVTKAHSDEPEFRQQRALAVLSLAIETNEAIGGGLGPVTAEQLRAAAEDMKAVAERLLRVGFSDRHDLIAHVNNAAMLLRLCEDPKSVEDLIVRALPQTGPEPQLRRLLALSQLHLERAADAIATLAGDEDAENRLLRAQLLADAGELAVALQVAAEVDDVGQTDRLLRLKWEVIGDVALRMGDDARVAEAVESLRRHEPEGVTASLLAIRAERRKAGVAGQDASRDALRALAAAVPADLEILPRFAVAEALCEAELADEASRLLESHVDLTRPSPAANLYLRSLADARRDSELQRVLDAASPELRDDPATQWVVATHTWNLGDLPTSLAVVNAILAGHPEHSRARLLRVEIFIRQARAADIQAELAKPIEDLDWKGRSDIYRLASLLAHFGHNERAAALGYRLFLEHRDESRAWLTFSGLVLTEGRGAPQEAGRWLVEGVAKNTAVDLAYDDGEAAFFVLEPDVRLRRLDEDSWEPTHPLARAVMGLKAEERFVAPDGREGVVRQVRHKYVARLHYVLERHEARFPASGAIRMMGVDPSVEGGLDELIAETKTRRDWVAAEAEEYRNGALPLSLLAQRTGTHVIDAAQGLVAEGVKLRVASGTVEERAFANRSLGGNARRGCVFDTHTFWTAWRLDALDVVVALAGPISVPQSLLDSLRARIEELQPAAAGEGLKTFTYHDGKLALNETGPEAVAELVADLKRATGWLEQFATVAPVIAGEDLPPELREVLRSGVSDFYDSLLLAAHEKLLLISDDHLTRTGATVLGVEGATWLHHLFTYASGRRRLDQPTYVRWSVALLGMGQNYLSLTGSVLAAAAALEGSDTKAPGPMFRQLCAALGGREADPESHLRATVECLGHIWGDPASTAYRQPVTSHLLRSLIRDREDYGVMLRKLYVRLGQGTELARYFRAWLRGHFLLH